MSNDKRLVYSTESGQLDKAMNNKQQRRKKVASSSKATITNPAKQGVRIRRESKGRGGKTVSIIDGLPLDAPALKTLMKKMKGALGTGGAVKNGSLEIQGEHREKLLLLLEKEGFKAKISGG